MPSFETGLTTSSLIFLYLCQNCILCVSASTGAWHSNRYPKHQLQQIDSKLFRIKHLMLAVKPVSPKFFKNSKIILNNVQVTTSDCTRWWGKKKLMKVTFYDECTHCFLHVTIVQLNLVIKHYNKHEIFSIIQTKCNYIHRGVYLGHSVGIFCEKRNGQYILECLSCCLWIGTYTYVGTVEF